MFFLLLSSALTYTDGLLKAMSLPAIAADVTAVVSASVRRVHVCRSVHRSMTLQRSLLLRLVLNTLNSTPLTRNFADMTSQCFLRSPKYSTKKNENYIEGPCKARKAAA